MNLKSILKTVFGVVVVFLLLLIVIGVYGSDDSKDATTTTPVDQAPAAVEQSTVNETPAPKSTETDQSAGKEVAVPTEDQKKEDNSAEYEQKLKEEEADKEEEEETPAETEKSSGNEVDSPTESTQKTGGVYDIITWDYYKTDKIGSLYTAESGKNYYVVTIKFDNTGSDTYSSNAFYWKLNADGVSYSTDAATFSLPGYKLVDVGPGGKAEAQLAFLVDGEPSKVDLEYVGF